MDYFLWVLKILLRKCVTKWFLRGLRLRLVADMILGIGTDLVDIRRIERAIGRFPDKFSQRIFSKAEIREAKLRVNSIDSFAKRFAAKESLSKAIGTGFRKGMNFKDISIINDKYGKPKFKINNNVKKLIYSKYKIKKFKISLSLADEKKYSIAFSVIHK